MQMDGIPLNPTKTLKRISASRLDRLFSVFGFSRVKMAFSHFRLLFSVRCRTDLNGGLQLHNILNILQNLFLKHTDFVLYTEITKKHTHKNVNGKSPNLIGRI